MGYNASRQIFFSRIVRFFCHRPSDALDPDLEIHPKSLIPLILFQVSKLTVSRQFSPLHVEIRPAISPSHRFPPTSKASSPFVTSRRHAALPQHRAGRCPVSFGMLRKVQVACRGPRPTRGYFPSAPAPAPSSGPRSGGILRCQATTAFESRATVSGCPAARLFASAGSLRRSKSMGPDPS